MAKALALLFALLVFVVPAGAARKNVQKSSRGVLKDGEKKYKCKYEQVYTPPGSSDKHRLLYVKGIGSTPSKCRVKCRAMRFSQEKLKISPNVYVGAYEKKFVEDVAVDKSDRKCKCKSIDGQLLVPPYTYMGKCSQADCWSFHKTLFNIEGGTNNWLRVDDSCSEECEPGVECDKAILGDTAEDVPPHIKELLRKVKDWEDNRNPDEKNPSVDLPPGDRLWWNFVNKAGIEDPVPERKEKVVVIEWREKENARCSKPCDDGGEEVPYLVNPWVCYEDDTQVANSKCTEPQPSERVECTLLPECRTAWSTEPINSIARLTSGKTEMRSDVLPLDGPWIEEGAADWNGLVISDTTPTKALVAQRGDEDDSPGISVYSVDVDTGNNALTYVDELGSTRKGTYDKENDRITWDSEEGAITVWVRRDTTNLVPLLNGAWVSKDSGEPKGSFDVLPGDTAGTFTALTIDGTAIEAQVKIEGNTIQRFYPEDGILGGVLKDKPIMEGTLDWDDELGVDTISWTPTKHTPFGIKPSSWVRMPVPTVSAGSFGACSQTCVPEGEEPRGTQTRTVQCVVETGGPFSGKWEVRADSVCEELMGGGFSGKGMLPGGPEKPPATRPCDPRPPACGDWEVVCRGIHGDIAGDEECGGSGKRPAI